MAKQTVQDLKAEGRKGVLDIPFHILDNTDLQIISHIMSKIVILDVKSSLWTQTQRYYCVSSEFRQISEGEVIPTYNVVVTATGDSPNTLGFKIEFEEVSDVYCKD